MQPFHLAFPVHDLAAAGQLYIEVLGRSEGRSSREWIDFNLYGYQAVAHLVVADDVAPTASNSVDGHDVPVPHIDSPARLGSRLLLGGVARFRPTCVAGLQVRNVLEAEFFKGGQQPAAPAT